VVGPTAQPVVSPTASPFEGVIVQESSKAPTATGPVVRPQPTAHPTSSVKPTTGAPTHKTTTGAPTPGASLASAAPTHKTTGAPLTSAAPTRKPTTGAPTHKTTTGAPTPSASLASAAPTHKTTGAPLTSAAPTHKTTGAPLASAAPTHKTTGAPLTSAAPTRKTTRTVAPVQALTLSPAAASTLKPSTGLPSKAVTASPSKAETASPTSRGTKAPASARPTAKTPTAQPTKASAPSTAPPAATLSRVGLGTAGWGTAWEIGVVYELVKRGAIGDNTAVYTANVSSLVGAAACLGGLQGLHALLDAQNDAVDKCAHARCDGFYAGILRKQLADVGDAAKQCYGFLRVRLQLLQCADGQAQGTWAPAVVSHYATVEGVVSTAVAAAYIDKVSGPTLTCRNPNLAAGNAGRLDGASSALPCASLANCIGVAPFAAAGVHIYTAMSGPSGWDAAKWPLAVATASGFANGGFNVHALFKLGRQDARFWLAQG